MFSCCRRIMCCKEEATVNLRQAKIKAYWKACKARKKSCLRRRRKGGRRVLRKNAGFNATRRIGRKRIAMKSNYCENSAEFWSLNRLKRVRRDGSFCNTAPVGSSSPVFAKKEKSARETDIESLPLDILVQIVCNVRHDELKPLFHVSSKFREAVLIARQMHFDYTTPVRARASKSRANSLRESSENYSIRFEGLECFFSSSKRPATPNAPKQLGKNQESRISSEDMKEVATLLSSPGIVCKDNDATFAMQNHFLRSVCATSRVLFVRDELCKQLFETDFNFRAPNPAKNS